MIRQAHIAVPAFRHPAAGAAFNHRRKASPVLKENDLLFLFQCFPYLLQEQRRELCRHPLFAGQFLDIHHLNLRQLNPAVAFG